MQKTTPTETQGSQFYFLNKIIDEKTPKTIQVLGIVAYTFALALLTFVGLLIDHLIYVATSKSLKDRTIEVR